MAVIPDLADLEATVARMEARFDTDPRASSLMASYRNLCIRFEADLADPRDIALSRAAALMTIKYQLGET
ncbi:hypothetical protein [Pelagibacterium sp.]|uniref:hypothetical protein n=1 Tax=Pelagibacterium sp. TaxID=1967288 RepID=UPI003BA8B23C